MIATHKSPWKLLPPSDLDARPGSASSAVLCGDLNCKYLTWNNRANNSFGHPLGAYANEHGLCVLGPSNQHLATTGKMGVLDIAILKDILLSTATEALHEQSSDHPPVILELGTEKDSPKTSIHIFIDWDKYADVETTLQPCPSLTSMPAMLDDAVDFFETALNMAHNTATIACLKY
ncbi:hypothetical protein Zmor_003878 [Zophobas morio]|uniref:Endonuclease/exonuclease/phosphatase domain-containing protein n=1 Tax=Zophobas morio TaxID=2755281 RepID=A0AA38HNA3_9CUCU|nr:hypothetical protein Zmor_003878 [Zophobas morio]